MLVDEYVEVRVTGKNRFYYSERGYVDYSIKNNVSITVKIDDLQKGSAVKIHRKCDGCGNVSEIAYCNYINKLRDGGKSFCKKCITGKFYSLGQYMIDNGLDVTSYWSNTNKIDPFNVWHGESSKFSFICHDTEYHGEYIRTANDFSRGNRCPFCKKNGHFIHKLDSVGNIIPESLLHVSSDVEKDKLFTLSKGSKVVLSWKCEKGIHGDFKRAVRESVNVNFRCPSCSDERDESFLQEKVRLYLESLNLTILHEHCCTLRPINPKTNFPLFYDNEIKELKLVIEVNGKQHYDHGKTYHKSFKKLSDEEAQKEFDYYQYKDAFKKQYALDNGYYFLEIPYWTDNKREDWKTLIDEKIKEILNQ